jgi:hypothetical protein
MPLKSFSEFIEENAGGNALLNMWYFNQEQITR